MKPSYRSENTYFRLDVETVNIYQEQESASGQYQRERPFEITFIFKADDIEVGKYVGKCLDEQEPLPISSTG